MIVTQDFVEKQLVDVSNNSTRHLASSTENQTKNAEFLDVCKAELVEVEVLPSLMTKVEAQQCLRDIKDVSKSLRQKLLELDLRQGWATLGYPSMTACLKDQFSDAGSKSNLIREWNAGQLEHELGVQICTYPAYQLRPLRKLQPAQRQLAWQKVQELTGHGRLKAQHVELVVSQFLKHQSVENRSLLQTGKIVIVDCSRAIKAAYTLHNGCWGIVVEVLTNSYKVNFMGQEWIVDSYDLKEMELVDETLELVAKRVVTLLQRDDLDEMEREILESYHRRYKFSDWQIQLLELIADWRFDKDKEAEEGVAE